MHRGAPALTWLAAHFSAWRGQLTGGRLAAGALLSACMRVRQGQLNWDWQSQQGQHQIQYLQCSG